MKVQYVVSDDVDLGYKDYHYDNLPEAIQKVKTFWSKKKWFHKQVYEVIDGMVVGKYMSPGWAIKQSEKGIDYMHYQYENPVPYEIPSK